MCGTLAGRGFHDSIAHATSPQENLTFRVNDLDGFGTAQRCSCSRRTHGSDHPGPSADGMNVFVYLSMLPLAQTHTRSAVPPSDYNRCRRGALRLRNVHDEMITQPGGPSCALSARPGAVSRVEHVSRAGQAAQPTFCHRLNLAPRRTDAMAGDSPGLHAGVWTPPNAHARLVATCKIEFAALLGRASITVDLMP